MYRSSFALTDWPTKELELLMVWMQLLSYIDAHFHTSSSVTVDLATDEQQAEAQTFYEDLGALAQDKKSVTTPLLPYVVLYPHIILSI